MLQHRLLYTVSNLQTGDLNSLEEHIQVKEEINNWYKNKSVEAFEMMFTRSVDESESMTIFHHETHKKRMKQSSILKLETADKQVVTGHDACMKHLEKHVKDLLAPTVLDSQAQNVLLAGVKEVFSDEDRANLSKEPTLKEVKSEVWQGNLLAAPGSDGIILFFYKHF